LKDNEIPSSQKSTRPTVLGIIQSLETSLFHLEFIFNTQFSPTVHHIAVLQVAVGDFLFG